MGKAAWESFSKYEESPSSYPVFRHKNNTNRYQANAPTTSPKVAAIKNKAKRLRGRSTSGKIPVVGACQIENGVKRVRIERISSAKSKVLVGFAKRTVSPGAVIHTDSFRGYNRLSASGFAHLSVNHSKEYKAKNGACTNAIESVWSACRRHFVRFCGGYRHRINDFLAEMEMRFESGTRNFYRDLCAVLARTRALNVRK